jgi:hypothetical protein
LLPNGARGNQCAEVENFLAGVAQSAAWRASAAAPLLPLVLVDERFSTVDALGPMRALGFSARTQRERKDAAAAAVILQRVLDSPGGQALSRLRSFERDVGGDTRSVPLVAAPEGAGEDRWWGDDGEKRIAHPKHEAPSPGNGLGASVDGDYKKSRLTSDYADLVAWLANTQAAK